MSHLKGRNGFTIVELLIVIVVIGILAAIITVAYNGIQQRAKIAVIQGDLGQAAKQLEVYRVGTSASEQYPPDQATANLKASSGTTFNYQVNNSTLPPSYCLTAVNGSLSYRVSNTNTTPTTGTCTGVLASGLSCPVGFIVVPGSSSYGTSEFCVMKYEAKQASATVPISQASGIPWTSISQTNAILYSANVAGCSGCHLISEAEWLTITRNVLGVASNWSGGAVGSGYIYSGHNDNSPPNALLASTDDTNGYSGTGNSSSSGPNQRRTLTLSNGEVIWDLAGNVSEWTSGTIASGQQPGLAGDTGFGWKEYNNSALLWNGLPAGAQPGNVYPGAGSWSSVQGIGLIYSYYGPTATRGYLRGAYWSATSWTGVLNLVLSLQPSDSDAVAGFRVAK